MSYPVKRNLYIYSKKTAEGFLRMKRQGFPRPLFSLQDRLAKLLEGRYKAMVRSVMKQLKGKLARQDITLDKAPEEESIDDLLKFFEEQNKELEEANKKFIDKVKMQGVAHELEREWHVGEEPDMSRVDELYGIGESFQTQLENILHKERTEFMDRLMKDAGGKLKNLSISYEIDKNKFFADNLDEIKRLYLDNSVKRVIGEEDYIKRKILNQIIDYATGKSDELKLSDLVKAGYEGSNHLARLFARDQMQRFNKACTLATFQKAGVTKVKWVTCGDGRVRNKGYVDKKGVFHRAHTALNGQIFDVNNLPPEIDDYNCRCGLVPVEWADD